MININEKIKSIFNYFAAEGSKSKSVCLKFGKMNYILLKRRSISFNPKSHIIENGFSFAWTKRKRDFFICPKNESNPHIIISGMSGFGKSTLFKSLLMQIRSFDIPCIIFDAHNEHADVVRNLKGSVHNAIYSGINILELDGASVSERISELTRLFKEVYALGYIQSTKLSECLWYTYRKSGARSRSDRSIAKAPVIKDLLDELSIFIKNSKSQGERNTLIHLRDRISLLNNTAFSGNFLSLKDISNELHSFSLASMKSKEVQYIYIGELLNRIYATMHDRERKHTLKLYIMIDEAQFITDNSESNAIIPKLIEEGRKYGVGIIIVTHAASTLNKKIIGNSSTFVSFYAREPSEVSYISKVLSGNDNYVAFAVMGRLNSLQKNEAIVISNEFRSPVVISTPNFNEIKFERKEISYSEAKELMKTAAKRPIRRKDANTPNNIIDKLIVERFVDKFLLNEEWIMWHNPSLSIEHEVNVKIISEFFQVNGITHRIVDNSTGPDIVAFIDGKKIAIEYETGSKSLESTSKMINSRILNYDRIVIITKNELLDYYINICADKKIDVISHVDYEKHLKGRY